MLFRMTLRGKRLVPRRFVCAFLWYLRSAYASQGQTFMVIGTAGELPKPPEKPIVFLEGL